MWASWKAWLTRYSLGPFGWKTVAWFSLIASHYPIQPLSRKPIMIQPDGSNTRKAGHRMYRCRMRHQNLQPDTPPIWWKKIGRAADWSRGSWSLCCEFWTSWYWWFLGSRSWDKKLQYATQQYTTQQYTTQQYTTVHNSTQQDITAHCTKLHYATLIAPHHNYNCNRNYITLTTLHYNYNSTTLQLQQHYTTPHPAVVG